MDKVVKDVLDTCNPFAIDLGSAFDHNTDDLIMEPISDAEAERLVAKGHTVLRIYDTIWEQSPNDENNE